MQISELFRSGGKPKDKMGESKLIGIAGPEELGDSEHPCSNGLLWLALWLTIKMGTGCTRSFISCGIHPLLLASWCIN
eukprot:4382679-Ditylum_brightwellii.AAC.1